MKKNIIILIIILILCSGCSKKEEIKKKEKKKVDVEYVEHYKDLNTTPIGFYSIDGNGLTKLTKINKTIVPFEDIGLFQVYPSNEERVMLSNGFGADFYNEWTKYNTNNNIKIGFNIKFKTDEEEISYNIFNPSNCMDKWEYVMNYLYDDFANRGKSFYSHIEENEYNDSTLFTAIKVQSNDKALIIKDKILLTVFTYDSEDDFLDNEYRGNSSSTLTICLNNNC